MFSTAKLYNKRVYITNGKGVRKSYGKIRSVVFHPSELRAVGVIVKRPDLALMVKRKDRFVAFDRMEIRAEGPLIIDQEDTWDKAACRRLGIDYEKCVLWDFMPVTTLSGSELGKISTVFFDEGTFEIDHIDISTSATNRKILGATNIERGRIIGYRDGAIVVDGSASTVTEAGGMAAAAGEAWANAKNKGSRAAQQAGKRAGETVDKGAYNLGRAIGSVKNAASETAAAAKAEARRPGAGERAGKSGTASAVGKQLGRASHMFSDFKSEFDKASRGE